MSQESRINMCYSKWLPLPIVRVSRPLKGVLSVRLPMSTIMWFVAPLSINQIASGE